MTTASRSHATAPSKARLASGLLPLSYTTTGDVTPRKPSWAADLLTEKQKVFVKEYLIDLCAGAAATRAGYSPKTAAVMGSRLLGLPHIAAAIAKAMEERSKRVEITADRVLHELALIALANMRDYVSIGAEGKEKGQASIDLSRLNREQFAAIGEITIEDIESGRRTGKRTRFKLLDKRAALVDLGKHLGLFVDRSKVEHSGTIDIENAAREHESRLLEAVSSVRAGADSSRIH